MALTDGLSAIARAVAATQRPSPAGLQWGTVTSAGAVPTVVLDADDTATPRQVSANAAGPLRIGWRVLLDHQGTRLTVLAAPDARAGGPAVYAGSVTVPLDNAAYAQINVSLPAGRFTDTTRMAVVGNATNHDTRAVVRTYVQSTTSITIGVRHVDGTVTTGDVPVSFIVAQTDA